MKTAAVLLFSLLSGTLFGQTGYEIKVTLKPFKNQYVYLGHYYGKQLPIIDSVKLNERSEGIFKGAKALGGGIYLIGFPDKSKHFEILIDKNQKFSVIADTADMGKRSFVGSPDNTEFKAYQEYMNTNGRAMDALIRARQSSKDSAAITTQIEVLNNQIRNYRMEIINRKSDALLPTLLRAMRDPEVPYSDPRAKTDSMFAYKYYKGHYWDGTDFMDDRLTRTPFFENRIDRYFEQLVYPEADSVIKELDWMLSYASVREDMQKFLLLKFVNRYLNQKYMWEDAVFVHLYTKYFSNNTYPWMTEQGKKTITERAYSLMANIMGSPAAEIELPNLAGKKTTLYGTDANFVLLAIWDPTCGHCKEVLPQLDSIYTAKWKSYGVKMFALAKETDGTHKDWTSFIDKYNLKDWVHVYYSREEEKKRISASIPGYSQLYDVQSFPTLYLLDKDKRIIAKKLSFEQVDEILELKLKK